MPLGIKPTVDFAFKKIFGSPENSAALIGLLNAILNLEHPIERVELRNPFSYQDFAENKLVVLDVRCIDGYGRQINVEMQVSASAGLIERMVSYACRMYVDQLQAGDHYSNAAVSISICLLRSRLFPDVAQQHHQFRMADEQSGRRITNAVEVHTVELTKYNLDEKTIRAASSIEQWAFLLLHAQEYDASELENLLPGIDFKTAIETIEVISGKTKDKQMYDQREQAQRDYEWAISGARQQGREEGREEGNLAGKIQVLQELLGEAVDSDEILDGLGLEALTAKLAGLQSQLRDRQA